MAAKKRGQKKNTQPGRKQLPLPRLPSLLVSVASNHAIQLAGLIVAVATFIVTFTVPEVRLAVGLDTQHPTPSEEPPIPVHLILGKGSVQVRQGQMLLVTTPSGATLLRFIFHPEGAAYEWRYLSSESHLEDTGTGVLYENYERTPTAEGAIVVDVGSTLSIQAGPLALTWSYRSPSSGWVYFTRAGATVLDDTTFSTFNLQPYLEEPSYFSP